MPGVERASPLQAQLRLDLPLRELLVLGEVVVDRLHPAAVKPEQVRVVEPHLDRDPAVGVGERAAFANEHGHLHALACDQPVRLRGEHRVGQDVVHDIARTGAVLEQPGRASVATGQLGQHLVEEHLELGVVEPEREHLVSGNVLGGDVQRPTGLAAGPHLLDGRDVVAGGRWQFLGVDLAVRDDHPLVQFYFGLGVYRVLVVGVLPERGDVVRDVHERRVQQP